MEDLDGLLEEILANSYRQIISNEEKILKSLGDLGMKEFYTLDVIANTTKNKTNTSNNIAKVLGITAGTLTTNLDRLTEKGYVYKDKNSSDKRVVMVYLTPSGTALRKKRENAHRKLISTAISRLSDTEKVALVSALNKLEF